MKLRSPGSPHPGQRQVAFHALRFQPFGDGQRLGNVRERVAGGKNQDSPVMEHIITRDSHVWRSFLMWRRIVNKGGGKASQNTFQTKGISGCVLIEL